MRAMRVAAMLAVVAAGASVVTSAAVEVVSAAPTLVPSSVETVPVQTSGDSMDDPAIWVHPTDPSLSLVFANNKLGALETYNLDGSLHQRLSDAVSFWGNVDVRQNVSIAGRTRDLVAVTHRGIQFYEVSPTTRMLEPITDGIAVGSSGEGLCMYQSGTGGTLYVVNITLPGRLRQYEVRDADGDGLVDVQLVRDFEVGSEAEGCVADDATGALVVSEEDAALWKYDAEPTGGTARTAIDRSISAGGRLAPDIEGVTLVTLPGGAGYYIVSAQNVADPNNSFFAVYERQAPHAFVTTFRVGNGTTSDDCDRTDGVAAVAADLGPNFPAGLFVCQDNNNDAPGGVGNQDLKLVRLDQIVDVSPGDNEPPSAAVTGSCSGLQCMFDASASDDPDGSIVGYSWEFGDATPPGEGVAPTHPYDEAGTYQVTLTVLDDGGATDTATMTVTVGTASSEISFVAQSSSPNSNSTSWTAPIPGSVQAGDILLAWFSAGSGHAPSGLGGSWQQVQRATDLKLAVTLWWRPATPADAGSSVRVSSVQQKGVLTLAAYRGVDTAGPLAAVGVADQPGLAANHATATVTSPVQGGSRVSFWTLKSSTVTTLTAPAGETVRGTTNGTGSGRVTTLLTDSVAPVPAGPQGNLVAVSDTSASKATGWTLVLRPATATPPDNEPPTAVATSLCSGLSCTFDGTDSSDSDGTVEEYSWDFGDDSGSVSGPQPEHAYGAAGTYVVTLTVTDDGDLTDTTTTNVTVTAPPVI